MFLNFYFFQMSSVQALNNCTFYDHSQVWPFTFQQQQHQNQTNGMTSQEPLAPTRPQEHHGAWYERDTSTSNHYNVHFYSTLSSATNSSFEHDKYQPKNGIPDQNSSLSTENGWNVSGKCSSNYTKAVYHWIYTITNHFKRIIFKELMKFIKEN